MPPSRRQLRNKKRRAVTRRLKGGIVNFSKGIQPWMVPIAEHELSKKPVPQPIPGQPIQSTSQWTANSKAPNWTGDHKTIELGAPGVLGYRFMVNSQGRTQSNITGIPQHLAAARYVVAPGPEGRLGGQDKLPVSGFTTEAPKNYYGVFGVTAEATPAQIQSAYVAKKATVANNATRKNIEEGYAILSDPVKRQQYNVVLSDFYRAHPPNMADLSAMYSKTGQSNPVTALKYYFR